MSKIMKCPCCGSELSKDTFIDKSIVWSCSKCLFECPTEHMPRISVAMGYATLLERHNELWKNVVQLEDEYQAMSEVAVFYATSLDKRNAVLNALAQAVSVYFAIHDGNEEHTIWLKKRAAARAEVETIIKSLQKDKLSLKEIQGVTNVQR